jgi:hypothetical protein
VIDDYLDRPSTEGQELDWRDRADADECRYLQARIDPASLSLDQVNELGWEEEARRRRFLAGEAVEDREDGIYSLLNAVADGDLQALKSLVPLLPEPQANLATRLLNSEGPADIPIDMLNDRGLWPAYYELWGSPNEPVDPSMSDYHTWAAFDRAYGLVIKREFDLARDQLKNLAVLPRDSPLRSEVINLRAYIAVIDDRLVNARALLLKIDSDPVARANASWILRRIGQTTNERGLRENPYLFLGVDHGTPRSVWRKGWADLQHRFHDDINELSVIGDAKDMIVELERSEDPSGLRRVFVVPLDPARADLPSDVLRSLLPGPEPYPRGTSSGSPELLEPYRLRAIKELLHTFATQHPWEDTDQRWNTP